MPDSRLRNEAMLSFVSDQPYCFHHLPSNTHICFWMGLGITRAQAMLMIANWKELAFINTSTVVAASREFKDAYVHGAFGEVDWRYVLDDGSLAHFTRLMSKTWTKLCDFDPHNHFVKRNTLRQCFIALQHEEVLNT